MTDSSKPAEGLPAPDGEAPLEELSRDHLSVLLYTTFTPDELLDLVKKLGITARGFRPEHLSEVELADLLADEVRASRPRRKIVLERMREIFGTPALASVPLEAAVAAELCGTAIEETGMVRLLWRVLADPDRAVRGAALPALQRLYDGFYGEPPPGEEGDEAPEPEGQAMPEPDRALKAELAAAKRTLEKALRERDRATSQLEGLKDQLRDARSELGGATAELGAVRKAATRADETAAQLDAALKKARDQASAAELARLRREHKEAVHRAEVAESRVAEVEEERTRTASTPSQTAPQPRPVVGDSEEIEEAPATWLLPVYTREFYDSLQGWDRRIQRAAFKQAHLLAQDHRHPSLRALPLEGLPNLYRVRVATDVRLLYRRGDGNTVEILSLIDREDLDRYIKQAKERA